MLRLISSDLARGRSRRTAAARAAHVSDVRVRGSRIRVPPRLRLVVFVCRFWMLLESPRSAVFSLCRQLRCLASGLLDEAILKVLKPEAKTRSLSHATLRLKTPASSPCEPVSSTYFAHARPPAPPDTALTPAGGEPLGKSAREASAAKLSEADVTRFAAVAGRQK